MDYHTHSSRTTCKPAAGSHLTVKCCIAATLFVISISWINACAYNIYEAAHWGNNEKVMAYLDNGAGINTPDHWGRSPLAVAMFRRHYDTARMLIEKGADINVIDKPYDTPLIIYPVYDGNLEMVRYLIDQGANVNLVGKKGFTALMEAAYRGDTDIGRLLLDHGADVNAVTVENVTARSNARGRGHKAFEEMLGTYIAAVQKTQTVVAKAEIAEVPVSDVLAYQQAQNAGTIPAYEKYRQDFPSGRYAAEALAKLDNLYFNQATRVRSLEANREYLERFPNGKHALLARQRSDYLPLMNACLKMDSAKIDQFLAAGKSLAGYAEPALMLMQLLQKQTLRTMRMSDFQVKGMQGPSKEAQIFDLGVFMYLLDAGADTHALRIKGFEKAGRKSLDGVAEMYSTGNPGEIVLAAEGGLSAVEFAEVNGLSNFKKLLLSKRRQSEPSKAKRSLPSIGKAADSGKAKTVSARRTTGGTIKVGALSYRTPEGFISASDADASKLKVQVESSIRETAMRYRRDTNNAAELYRIDSFRAFQLPGKDGWVASYMMHIPPQKDYLSTLEKEQQQKIQWGIDKGWVTRVFEQGRIQINGADILKVDTALRDGRRTIGFYCWTEKDPGGVAQISIVIKPGRYKPNAGKIETLIESIHHDK